MAFHPDRQIIIELIVNSDQPALLEGLDVWLRLGLIPNSLVRQICQEQLVCRLPEARASQVVPSRIGALQPADSERRPVALTDFLPVEPESRTSRRSDRYPPTVTRSASRPPTLAGQALQSFMAEVSVVWLLFLGVFLVVISSGVLAATQWRNFSPVGQYGILFGYTLAFWLTSLWTERQRSLQLTSWMLKITTLLIIPVNVWTMDGFQLWSSPLSLLMSVIAAVILSSITILLLNRDRGSKLMVPTAIALSWLHWGWSWPGVPFIATYIGTIGAAIALLVQDEGNRGQGSGETEGAGEDFTPHSNSSGDATRWRSQSEGLTLLTPHSTALSTIAIAIAALLLIGRAVLVAQVPVNQLGLAIGVCGWLLCWLARRDSTRDAWTQAGIVLLTVAWLVAVTVTPPWQALAISGLGLWVLIDHLWRLGQVPYLTASFLVGLQATCLVWRVVPLTWQARTVEFCERLAGTQGIPLALVGIGVFPYLLLTVWLAFRLRSWQRPDLARHAEQLALGLGVVLTAFSLANPTVRSLNLVLSTLTLAVVTFSRSRPEAFLIYLTHGIGLAAISSGIDLAFPTLSSNHWAAVLLAGMVAEWIVSGSLAGNRQQEDNRTRRHGDTGNQEDSRTRRHGGMGNQAEELTASPRLPLSASSYSVSISSPHISHLHHWQLSAWHYGLILSAISYRLLWSGPWWQADNVWDAIWLITPIALTALAYRDRFLQPRLAGWLSVIALFLVQPFILGSIGERLTSLGLATVLMMLNTRRLRHSVAAILTVGFGLEFAAATAWQVFAMSRTVGLAVNWLAIAVLVLWLLRGWLTQQQRTLDRLYKQATDGWAIALTALNLSLLTLCSVIAYLKFNTLVGQFGSTWQYVLAAALMLIAISYRNWRDSSDLGFYGIAWSLELLIISGFALIDRPADELAIANLALALGTQLAGDWWIAKWGMGSGDFGVSAQSNEWGVGEDTGTRRHGDTENEELTASPRLPLSASTSSPRTPYLAPRTSHPIPSSWHVIPLLFAALELIIQHRTFTATTGLYTLAAALVGIGVGRRQPSLKPLTYLSVLGVSIAAYELLIYQLSQATGGSAGDGITLLAALAAGLAIGYRLLSRWLVPYLRLTVQELQVVALLHWILGNGLLVMAIANPRSSSGQWLWTGIAAVLAAYALVLGNQYLGVRQDIPASPISPSPLAWTYAGIVESLITFAYLLRLLLPDALLIDWAGAIASIIAVIVYFAPWQHWGWEEEPWRQTAFILPGGAVLLTAVGTNPQSLLIVAAYYAWLANTERQIRLSYISVVLADWAILRLLDSYNTREPLWYAAVVGVSLLYIAQIDPDLRSQDDRDTRHLLRSLATGLICLTAFYQSEVGMAGLAPVLAGLLAIALQLGFVLAGLLLRVRAFLYVGTATFILQVLWQLWRFVSDYSLLLWTLGILVGLSLIWIAATFEARRAQVNALLQHWVTELEEWE